MAQNEKMKKIYLAFLFQKYDKFEIFSTDNFIKHKPLISKTCNISNMARLPLGYIKMVKKKIMNALLVIIYQERTPN